MLAVSVITIRASWWCARDYSEPLDRWGISSRVNFFLKSWKNGFKFFFFNFLFTFTFGPTGSSLFAQAFSNCCKWGLLSSCSAWASHFSGFSCFRAQALGAWLSVVAAFGLSSCTGLVAPRRVESSWTRDQTHAPIIGRFLSTVPPGKSWALNFSPKGK